MKFEFMKTSSFNYILGFISFLLMQHTTVSGQATLEIELKNAPFDSVYVIYKNPYNFILKQRYFKKALVNGKATLQFDIEKLTAIEISADYFIDSTEQSYTQTFYLEMGNDIFFTKDFSNPDTQYTISGNGANNNQPLQLKDLKYEQFRNDSLPDNVLNTINQIHNQNKELIKIYIAEHRPTPSLKELLYQTLAYKNANLYASFWASHRYNLMRSPRYSVLKNSWINKRDSLFSTLQLNNEKALVAADYSWLVYFFTVRTMEELWENFTTDSQSVYQNWYGELTADSAVKVHAYDNQNQLQERIINRYFNGPVAEYLYGFLYYSMKNFGKYENAIAINDRFLKKFPGTKFSSISTPIVNRILNAQNGKWTKEMKIVPGNNELKSFDQVQEYFKGKTVLIDMWGTWCGPCRIALEMHSKEIREWAKDHNVELLYVANFDEDKVVKWKELISFYQLEGYHILASNALTKSMETKTKFQGYPSYIILKKDGTFILADAGLQMRPENLFRQLESVR